MPTTDFQIAFGHYDNSPEHYYLSEEDPLRAAIHLALKLGKPLLITGEPGTGKTQLAYWAAWYLAQRQDARLLPFLPRPFVFHTKTHVTGRELFYHYDAIAHFQDKEGRKPAAAFISLAAMGQAIAQTHGRHALAGRLGLEAIRNWTSVDGEPHSSVLLVDEIDKAPRDFTNDLLHEMESSHFAIPELEQEIARSDDRRARVLMILTSNSEKNLPDAFLRRCLFFNVAFPGEEELLRILLTRLGPFLSELERFSDIDLEQHYRRVIRLFQHIRKRSVVKPPSTSELIDWVKVLHLEGLLDRNFEAENIRYMGPEQKRALQLSLYALVKTREDLEAIESELGIN
jgi:MoxR-like ATPase